MLDLQTGFLINLQTSILFPKLMRKFTNFNNIPQKQKKKLNALTIGSTHTTFYHSPPINHQRSKARQSKRYQQSSKQPLMPVFQKHAFPLSLPLIRISLSRERKGDFIEKRAIDTAVTE